MKSMNKSHLVGQLLNLTHDAQIHVYKIQVIVSRQKTTW